MPKPNCTEEIDVGPMDFGQVGRRVVEGRFDGGSMTSDGGVVLLGQVDRKLGLMDAAARCIADPRSPLLIKHGVRNMLRQCLPAAQQCGRGAARCGHPQIAGAPAARAVARCAHRVPG